MKILHNIPVFFYPNQFLQGFENISKGPKYVQPNLAKHNLHKGVYLIFWGIFRF